MSVAAHVEPAAAVEPATELADPADLDDDEGAELAEVVHVDVPGRTVVQRHATGPLSISADQEEPTELQLAALAEMGMPIGGKDGFTAAAVMNLLHHAQVTGLDPFKGEIRLIRTWNTLDDGSRRLEFAVMVHFNAMVGLALATGQERGREGPQFYDEARDKWVDVWTDRANQPTIARARVLREGRETDWSVVYLDEVCPHVHPMTTTADGRRVRDTTRLVPHPRWDRKGTTMLGKCALAAAYRAAFADAVGSIYIGEELERARQEAQDADDEMERARARRDARDTAADIRRLADAGRGQPDAVIVGEVLGDAPSRGATVTAHAADRAREASQAARDRAAGCGASDWTDTAADQKGAWLWEEMEHAADLLGMSLDDLTGRYEILYGPRDTWTWEEVRDVVGPLRPTVAQKLRDAGRPKEADALDQIGPDVVAELDYLLGRLID